MRKSWDQKACLQEACIRGRVGRTRWISFSWEQRAHKSGPESQDQGVDDSVAIQSSEYAVLLKPLPVAAIGYGDGCWTRLSPMLFNGYGLRPDRPSGTPSICLPSSAFLSDQCATWLLRNSKMSELRSLNPDWSGLAHTQSRTSVRMIETEALITLIQYFHCITIPYTIDFN
jgi:hypothetical protein